MPDITLRSGRTVSFLDDGDPSGAVVLHAQGGLFSSAYAELAGPTALSLRVRLITPDRPGSNRSSPQPGRTLKDWADDAVELLDTLGVKGRDPWAWKELPEPALAETLPEAYRLDPAAMAAGEPALEPPAPLRAGRIVVEVFEKECPKAAANFLSLVRGGTVSTVLKKELAYKGNRFHRIVRGFVAQAGVMNDKTGAGESVYGGTFNDDKAGLKMKHDAPGVLGMANSGKPNTNTSQFYLTFGKDERLDGKHVVFGRVVEGIEVLRMIEEEAAKEDGKPPKAVIAIADCGGL
ncbi:cyclophilin-like domain-containing protein [Hyaloraphidium curvatum]|nr:cyclophilin-like domain-containing protein [Hyaloraphidium curvatum]